MINDEVYGMISFLGKLDNMIALIRVDLTTCISSSLSGFVKSVETICVSCEYVSVLFRSWMDLRAAQLSLYWGPLTVRMFWILH